MLTAIMVAVVAAGVLPAIMFSPLVLSPFVSAIAIAISWGSHPASRVPAASGVISSDPGIPRAWSRRLIIGDGSRRIDYRRCRCIDNRGSDTNRNSDLSCMSGTCRKGQGPDKE